MAISDFGCPFKLSDPTYGAAQNFLLTILSQSTKRRGFSRKKKTKYFDLQVIEHIQF